MQNLRQTGQLQKVRHKTMQREAIRAILHFKIKSKSNQIWETYYSAPPPELWSACYSRL